MNVARLTEDGQIIFRVSGDVSEIIEFTDEMLETLKQAIFDAGVNAIEDFIGTALEFDTDEDMMEVIDEVMNQMPSEVLIKFYQKHVLS